MSERMMNTKEVADYLGIHEKQVYALIKAKKIPCTRITGKWLFMKELIDKWIADTTEKWSGKIKEKSKNVSGMLLASGSNDPVLDILLNHMKQLHPELYIFSSSTGSTEGLKLLSKGLTDISWCHLFDPKSGVYNIPYLSSYFSDKDVAVIHLFYRELGFLISRKSPVKIKKFEDLTLPGMSFINRQKGSGTRVYFDHCLEERGIEPSSISGYEREVYTHIEVGLSLISGEAHSGIATVAISKLFNLNFEPIVKESFDMVLSQSTFFGRGVQRFIESLNSKEFRQKVSPLGNYDFSESGKIIYS